MLRKLVSMRDALSDPAYFGEVYSGESLASWRVLLIAALGEELLDTERDLFQAVTAREREPLEPVAEFWGVIGRRGGKTRSMAVLTAYLAACIDHRHALGPGERGKVPLLAASTLQADQVSASSAAYSAPRAISPIWSKRRRIRFLSRHAIEIAGDGPTRGSDAQV
jgi:hypothetical protein